MTKPYLPNRATIQESCLWLEAETGEEWTLPRLLECHMRPYFWLDFSPGYPAIFGDRTEGYLAPMVYQGDIDRLSAERSDVVLVTWTLAHDGTPIKALEPHAWPVSIDDLRFLRKDIHRLAKALHKADHSVPSEKAAPEVIRKRAALIDEFSGMWPSIESDLHEGADNGLSAVAKSNKHGMWKVRESLNWAAEQGKIEKNRAEAFVRADGESEISALVRAMLERK